VLLPHPPVAAVSIAPAASRPNCRRSNLFGWLSDIRFGLSMVAPSGLSPRNDRGLDFNVA
jgi:hypothetical protein